MAVRGGITFLYFICIFYLYLFILFIYIYGNGNKGFAGSWTTAGVANPLAYMSKDAMVFLQ